MGVQTAWREYHSERVSGGIGFLLRPDDVFKPKVKVLHRVYGEGVVSAVRIRNGIKMVGIKFEEVGFRWILKDHKYLKVVKYSRKSGTT